MTSYVMNRFICFTIHERITIHTESFLGCICYVPVCSIYFFCHEPLYLLHNSRVDHHSHRVVSSLAFVLCQFAVLTCYVINRFICFTIHEWITFPTESFPVWYSFYASLQYWLFMSLNASSVSQFPRGSPFPLSRSQSLFILCQFAVLTYFVINRIIRFTIPEWITLPIESFPVLYPFCASLQHWLLILLTALSISQFPSGYLSDRVVPSVVFVLCQFAVLTSYVINRFIRFTIPEWITFPIESFPVLYSFCASLQYWLFMSLIA